MKRIELFIIIIFCETIGAFFLSRKILGLRQQVHGISSRIVNLSSFIPQNNSSLKYFYEPQALTLDTEYPIWSEKKPYIKINSDTLNSLTELSTSSAHVSIVTLGDSFTYGQYVNTSDNWSSRLKSDLGLIDNRIQIANLGEKGYDIEYAVERYRIRGQKYNPKLVIWLLKYDDFISIAEKLTPLISEQKTMFEKGEMKDKKELAIPKEGDFEPAYITRAVNIYLKQMGGLEKVYEYQKNQLAHLREYYKGNILIAILPGHDEQKKLITEWAQKDKKVFLIELPDIYKDRDAFFPDRHPNEKGHSIISEAIFNYLSKNRNLIK